MPVPDFVFAFHDEEELGPRMLARLARPGSPPVLTIEGSRPLVEARFGQGEIVVTMSSEPCDVPTRCVGSTNDDDRHPLA